MMLQVFVLYVHLKNDVYKLVDALKQQDDLTVIAEKDYIKNHKENGYRSYHLIVKVPIFLSDKVEHVAVEVQFRTIAMDFWASLEHKLRYKKNLSEEKEKRNSASSSTLCGDKC